MYTVQISIICTSIDEIENIWYFLRKKNPSKKYKEIYFKKLNFENTDLLGIYTSNSII